MQFLKNLSIKRKIILIVLVTTGAALTLAAIGLIANDFIRFRSETKHELISTAEIIGLNSTAALEFGDPEAGREILSALKENPHIVSAAIYTKDGELFPASRFKPQKAYNGMSENHRHHDHRFYTRAGKSLFFF